MGNTDDVAEDRFSWRLDSEALASLLGAAWSVSLYLYLSNGKLAQWAWLWVPVVLLIGSRFLRRYERLASAEAALKARYLLPFVYMITHKASVSIGAALAVMLGLGFMSIRNPAGFPRSRGARIGTHFGVPLFLFTFSFLVNYAPNGPIDLFHRGEALGPAQAYLNGLIPYRDVLFIHGLLEDGFFDYLLMEVFGPQYAVHYARYVIVSSCMVPALYLLILVIFRSSLLSFLVALWAPVVLSFSNVRTVWGLVFLILVTLAVRDDRKLWWVMCGGLTMWNLLWSYDIGLYSLTTTLVVLGVLFVPRLRLAMNLDGVRPFRAAVSWLAGFSAVALPFLIYFVRHGALREFLRYNLVTLPRTIDAIWSQPVGDKLQKAAETITISDWVALFRGNWSLHYVLPGVLVVAVSYFTIALVGGRWSRTHVILFPSLIFSLVLYRSAIGRNHVPFAAFPIALFVAFLFFRAIAQRHWRPLIISLVIVLGVFYRGFEKIRAYPAAPQAYWARLEGAEFEEIGIPRARGIRTTPEQKAMLEGLWAARQNVSAPYPFWDFTNQPALYFFLDAVNPTRFHQVQLASTPEHQREVIDDLIERRVPFILYYGTTGTMAFDGISNHELAPELTSFVKREYPTNVSVAGLSVRAK